MTVSLKLFGFTVQGIHNFSHFVNQLQCVLVCFIHWRFVKHDQHPRSLIQDSWKNETKNLQIKLPEELSPQFPLQDVKQLNDGVTTLECSCFSLIGWQKAKCFNEDLQKKAPYPSTLKMTKVWYTSVIFGKTQRVSDYHYPVKRKLRFKLWHHQRVLLC